MAATVVKSLANRSVTPHAVGNGHVSKHARKEAAKRAWEHLRRRCCCVRSKTCVVVVRVFREDGGGVFSEIRVFVRRNIRF